MKSARTRTCRGSGGGRLIAIVGMSENQSAQAGSFVVLHLSLLKHAQHACLVQGSGN